MKASLSLESQLDLPAPGAFPNLIFSMFSEVLILGAFLGPSLFVFLLFLMVFEVHLGSILGPFGEPKNQIKAPFSPEGPRRVPGRVLGVIFSDLGSHFRCIFDLIFNVFWVEFWHCFLYGICMECV